MRIFKIIAVILFQLYSCFGSEILMITIAGTKAHTILMIEIAKGLIERNHSITLITPFFVNVSTPNITIITPIGVNKLNDEMNAINSIDRRLQNLPPIAFLTIMKLYLDICESFLSDAEIKDLFTPNKNPDLLIIDGVYPECPMGLVYHFKKPFILFNPTPAVTHFYSMSGSPILYSVTPFLTLPFSDNMTPFQRVINVIWNIGFNLGYYLNTQHLQNVLKKYFGSQIPYINDMVKNTSLSLVNSHPSVYYIKPSLPSIIDVACLHCKPPKPLKSELEVFINEGENRGFIYISMGSNFDISYFPKKYQKIFLETFELLPYQVIVRWNYSDEIKGLPSNVMISKWLPQQDLLGHIKIKAFVSHGGLLSIYETVHHGVPIVTMPIYVDQDSNSAKAVQDGYAVLLELTNLTSKSLYDAIIEVSSNPKYRKNVKERQYLLKDQKEDPLKRAIYWIEHVIKYKGAEYFSSPLKDMNFIVYYSIDLFFYITVLSVALFLILQFIIRFVLQYLKQRFTYKYTKSD